MEFTLAGRIKTLDMGKVNFGTNEAPNLQDKFSEEHKVLSLFSSIVEEGRSTLLSIGISIDSDEIS